MPVKNYKYRPEVGKGDHKREGANDEAYRANYDKIDWSGEGSEPTYLFMAMTDEALSAFLLGSEDFNRHLEEMGFDMDREIDPLGYNEEEKLWYWRQKIEN